MGCARGLGLALGPRPCALAAWPGLPPGPTWSPWSARATRPTPHTPEPVPVHHTSTAQAQPSRVSRASPSAMSRPPTGRALVPVQQAYDSRTEAAVRQHARAKARTASAWDQLYLDDPAEIERAMIAAERIAPSTSSG